MANLEGKIKKAGEVAIDAAMRQIGNEGTMGMALGIGVVSGLLCGSVKRGIKTGLVVIGAYAGASIIMNVAGNWETIKKQ